MHGAVTLSGVGLEGWGCWPAPHHSSCAAALQLVTNQANWVRAYLYLPVGNYGCVILPSVKVEGKLPPSSFSLHFFHWDVSFVTKWWWVEFLFYLVLRNCCCTFTFQNQIYSQVWRVGWMRSESSLCTSVKLQLFPWAGVGVCLNWVLSSVLIVQPWQQDLQPRRSVSRYFLPPSMAWIAGNIKATS